MAMKQESSSSSDSSSEASISDEETTIGTTSAVQSESKPLTEVEREALLLDEYDEQSRLDHERQIRDEMEKTSSRPSRKSKSSSGQSNKRKEALSDLRRAKIAKLQGSNVVSRLEDEEEDGADDDQYQIRQRRKDLKLTSSNAHGEDSTSKQQEISDNDAEIDVSPPITCHQANFYLLRRRKFFEDHFFEPFFEELVKHNFARVKIGMHDSVPVYRMCQIKRLVELPKAYRFNGELTKQGLLLGFGKDTKPFRIDSISNRSITEEEFDFYAKKEEKLMTHLAAKKLRENNDRIIKSYRYTEEEISRSIQRRKKAGLGKVKLGVERVRLERDLKAAEHGGDQERSIDLTRQLNEIIRENTRREQKKSDSVVRMNEINRKNRKINQQRDLEARQLNQVEQKNMSAAEKLQYMRSKNDKMFLSEEALNKMLAEGKLIQQENGVITTSNKLQVVEVMPDDMHAKDSMVIVKADVQQEDEKEEVVKYFDKNTNLEIQTPLSHEDRSKVITRHYEADGTVFEYKPIDEIKKKQQPVLNATEKTRKGLSLKEYFKARHPPAAQ